MITPDNVQFPVDLTYGFNGGPQFNVVTSHTRLGSETRMLRSANSIHEYSFSYDHSSSDKLAVIRNFHRARRGSARGFRFRDPFDYQARYTRTTDGTLLGYERLTYNEVANAYELWKTYDDGSPYPYRRRITHPVESSVIISINGEYNLVPGSDFAVLPGGFVQLTDDFGEAMRAGFEFDVPVMFTQESDRLLSMTAKRVSSGEFDISITEIPIPNKIQLEPAYETPSWPIGQSSGSGEPDPNPQPCPNGILYRRFGKGSFKADITETDPDTGPYGGVLRTIIEAVSLVRRAAYSGECEWFGSESIRFVGTFTQTFFRNDGYSYNITGNLSDAIIQMKLDSVQVRVRSGGYPLSVYPIVFPAATVGEQEHSMTFPNALNPGNGGLPYGRTPTGGYAIWKVS